MPMELNMPIVALPVAALSADEATLVVVVVEALELCAINTQWEFFSSLSIMFARSSSFAPLPVINHFLHKRTDRRRCY